MHEAALQADIDPDRLSFVHALEVVREAVAEFQIVAVEQEQVLYRRLLVDIAAVRLPERQVRINPPVVKQDGRCKAECQRTRKQRANARAFALCC
jgi:hypothetical protein